MEEAVALRQAGQTVAQIATRFGFHRTTVARHLKQTGETLRTNPAVVTVSLHDASIGLSHEKTPVLKRLTLK